MINALSPAWSRTAWAFITASAITSSDGERELNSGSSSSTPLTMMWGVIPHEFRSRLRDFDAEAKTTVRTDIRSSAPIYEEVAGGVEICARVMHVSLCAFPEYVALYQSQ